VDDYGLSSLSSGRKRDEPDVDSSDTGQIGDADIDLSQMPSIAKEEAEERVMRTFYAM
jgi:hypothetical protein